MGFRDRLAQARGKSTQLPNNIPLLRHPQGVDFVYVVAPNSLQGDRAIVQATIDAANTANGGSGAEPEQIQELEKTTGLAATEIEQLLVAGKAAAAYDKAHGLSQTGVHSAVSSGLTLLTRGEDATKRQASQYVVRIGYAEGRVEFNIPGVIQPGFTVHGCLGLFVNDVSAAYIAVRECRIWTELCMPVVGARAQNELANAILLSPVESRARAVHYVIDAVAKAAGFS